MIDYGKIMIENKEKIKAAIIALEKQQCRYEVDLYLYPDGTTDEFVNVGGNSWRNDEHYVIYSSNHEYDDDDYSEYDDDELEEMLDEFASDQFEGAVCAWENELALREMYG